MLKVSFNTVNTYKKNNVNFKKSIEQYNISANGENKENKSILTILLTKMLVSLTKADINNKPLIQHTFENAKCTYFEDGHIKDEMYSDNTGRSYYENGKVEWEWLENGASIKYDENGKKVYERRADGIKRYYEDGILQEVTFPDGGGITYFDDGISVKTEWSSRGEKREYDKDGKILVDVRFKPDPEILEKYPDCLLDNYLELPEVDYKRIFDYDPTK